MNRWTLALLVAALVGLSIEGDAARAGSLLDALASVLSPDPHSISGQPQKPAARLAQPALEHPARHQARLRHPRDGKLPIVTSAGHELAVLGSRAPPVVPSASAVVSTGAESETLKPHGVQTVSVLPLAVPAALEGTQAVRPAADVGHEPGPAQAAGTLIEGPVAKPVIAPAPVPASALTTLLSQGMIECGLMLLFITCILVSTKSRSGARLPAFVRPAWGGLPLPPRINHLSRIGALIGAAEAAAKSARHAAGLQGARASAPLWGATRDCGGVGSSDRKQPPARSKHDERPDRGGPGLEDQLARIVQDEIAHPLRKAS